LAGASPSHQAVSPWGRDMGDQGAMDRPIKPQMPIIGSQNYNFKSQTRRQTAITIFSSYRASSSFGPYQIILMVTEANVCVNNLPTVVTWQRNVWESNQQAL